MEKINNRPASPSSSQQDKPGYTPDQLNPDLAAAKMADEIVKRLGSPSIISKKFAVCHGLLKSMNNTPGNPTGYDCSLRLAVYERVAANSVNIDGKYFERLWAYLMKPKYIIQGTPMGQSSFEEQKESIIGRVVNWFRGTPKQETGGQQQ